MTLDEAKAFLATHKRDSLVDGAFSDAEVYWENSHGDLVAEGYFSLDTSTVTVFGTTFTGDEARALRAVGRTGKTSRNDAGGR